MKYKNESRKRFEEALSEERSEYDPVEAVLEDLTYWSE